MNLEEALKIKKGNVLKVINIDPLKGKEYAPKLQLGDEVEVKNIFLDSKGNPHFDVGCNSEINFVTSFETGEELPYSNHIHWAHPSRFDFFSLIKNKK